MARPLKDGVDYFPKDTDFYADDKVRLLRALERNVSFRLHIM